MGYPRLSISECTTYTASVADDLAAYESFRLASRHLIERLREGRRDVELTPADGRRVLEFGLALQRSADENRPVCPDARS